MEFDEFPDAEAAAAYLIREADVPNVGARVYSSIPTNPTYPLIILHRFGGVPAERRRLDRARIQVEAWGGTKSQARTAAAAARVALLAGAGTTLSTGGGAPVNAFISEVEDELGLQWLPDPPTNRDRYIFGIAIYLHS